MREKDFHLCPYHSHPPSPDCDCINCLQGPEDINACAKIYSSSVHRIASGTVFVDNPDQPFVSTTKSFAAPDPKDSGQ